MKLIHRCIITVSILLCSSLVDLHGQNSNGILLKGNLNLGFSRPYNNPTKFPIGHTDSQLFPSKQTPNLGYQYSLSGLYSFSNSFSIGISSYISDYSITEEGEEISFWANKFYPYSIERSFKIYGIGILTGYKIFNKEVEMLQIFTGVNYGEFISTENVYLMQDYYNRTKILASFSIEYGRMILDDLFLVCG